PAHPATGPGRRGMLPGTPGGAPPMAAAAARRGRRAAPRPRRQPRRRAGRDGRPAAGRAGTTRSTRAPGSPYRSTNRTPIPHAMGTRRRVWLAVVATAVIGVLLPLTRAVAAEPVLVRVAGVVGEGVATDVAQRPVGIAVHGTTLYIADVHDTSVIRALDLT